MHPTRFIRLFIVLLVAASLGVALVYRERLTPGQVQAFVDGLGPWAPLVFIALWLLAAVLFLPGTVLTIAGGALFGPLWGTAYSLLGAVTGATLAYALGGYLGRDWVERVGNGFLGRLKAGVEAEGWRFVAFVRLVPVASFNLINLGLGLTRIPLRTYVLTTLLCMVPGTVGYSYVGFVGRRALMGEENWMQALTVALAIMVALGLLPFLVRRLHFMHRARQAGEGGLGSRDPEAPAGSWREEPQGRA